MREELDPAVYMLSNKRYGTLYVGVTARLWSRVWDHKNGALKGFTKTYGLTKLVWYEHHPSMASAIHREKRVKKYLRSWKYNLINAFNPEWLDLHDAIDNNLNRVEEFATRKRLSVGPPHARRMTEREVEGAMRAGGNNNENTP
jgi:putative endonuclease